MIDEFTVHELLTPNKRLVRESVRAYCDAESLPHIAQWWNDGDLPIRDVMRGFGQMGLLGPTTPEEYGGAGVSYSAYGAMVYELERADSGLRSAASVQGSLVMYPILTFGSDEQKKKWLPGLASKELIGCFGLTEPDGGSDPGAMRTRARLDDGEYVLNGNKMWITKYNVANM